MNHVKVVSIYFSAMTSFQPVFIVWALFLLPEVILALVGTNQAQSETCGFLDESNKSGDVRVAMPWTASIYHRANPKSSFEFFINGVIIGPTTVLAVYGGVFGAEPRGSKKKYSLPSPENSLVTAGFLSRNLQSSDSYSQRSKVEYILPYKGHEFYNQHFHFVIYRLSTPFNLNTPYVRAICLPNFSSWPNASVHDETFFNGGFVKLSPQNFTLLRLPMIRKSSNLCRSAFNYHYKTNDLHVFCATTSPTLGSRFPSLCLSHGNIAVKKKEGRWFLDGLLVLIPGRKRGDCNDNTLYFYGKLTGHVEWLSYNVRCNADEFPCFRTGVCQPLTSVCNSVEECRDSSDEDPTFCAAATFQRCLNRFACGLRGKCIPVEKLCDNHYDCPDKADERSNLCAAKSSQGPTRRPVLVSTLAPRSACFPLPVPEGVKLSCRDSKTGALTNCNAARVGTVAVMSCQPYYSAKDRETIVRMTCGSDGFWNPFKPFSCEPNCGIISTDVKGFLLGAQTATRSNAFPWHAALFAWDGTEFKYICGASLIEKRVLITSAHCLKDPSFRSPVRKYQVILAPASSDYSINLEDELAKVFDVVNFWTHPSYSSRTFIADLALIQVNDSVPYGQFIRPVCYLPRQNVDSNLINRSGKIAGFDLTEGGISELKYITAPVVSSQQCILYNRQKPPQNTFCAGAPNVSGLCRGDSGGGLVFSEKKTVDSGTRYILKGIASGTAGSSPESCTTERFTFFTDIEKYEEWIFTILESIDAEV